MPVPKVEEDEKMEREERRLNLKAGAAVLALMTLILIAVGLLVSCGYEQEQPQNDDSLKRVLRRGELILGFDANYPPMGFMNESGEIVGFDIDVAQQACTRMGVRLVAKPINWEEKEKLLNSGQIDCIWNGMSVTPERAEQMTLSEPYMKNGLIFMVTDESEARGNMDLVGGTVGVQSGSSAVEALENADFRSEIAVLRFNDNLSLLAALDEGRVDAALVDSVVAYYYTAERGKTYYVLPDSLSEENIAVGFRKGDEALRDRVQELIDEMKENGTLAIISTKWFGGDITIVK